MKVSCIEKKEGAGKKRARSRVCLFVIFVSFLEENEPYLFCIEFFCTQKAAAAVFVHLCGPFSHYPILPTLS